MEDDIVPRPSTAPVADNLRKCRGEKRADHGAAAKPDDDDDDDDDGGKAKKKGRGYKDNAVGVIVVDSGDEENDVRARVPKKMLPTPFKGSVAAALMSPFEVVDRAFNERKHSECDVRRVGKYIVEAFT